MWSNVGWASLDEAPETQHCHPVNIPMPLPDLTSLQTVSDHPHGKKYSPN